MLKIIVGFITVVALTGCFGSDSGDGVSKRKYNNLIEANNNLQRELSTCESMYKSLAMQVSGGGSSRSQSQQEREYEEVNVYEVDGTKCYATDDMESAAPACGRSFWKCKDGVLRECMTNVKYKISKERKLVEEEE